MTTVPARVSDVDQRRATGSAASTLALGLGVPSSAAAKTADSLDRAELWRSALRDQGPQLAAAQARGGFAVGVRESGGRTFLAVDRFASQTLCYRVVDGELRFAERADELADESTPIDPQAIFEYLYFHMIPSPRTIFRGVFRLPPGHFAVHEEGKLSVSPYWTPEFSAPAKGSFATLRDGLLQSLRNAVHAQLDGSRAACFLSGGVDSSTVAGMVGQVTGRPAATYSIGFDAQGYDEMQFARIAAKHFGTDHHEYYVTPDDLVRSIPDVAASYDQPFGNSSALPTYYCARQAQADGVSRLLAGDGGDELFGGNSRYAMQRVFGWYSRVPLALRNTLLGPFFGLPWVRRAPLLRKGSGYIAHADVPMPDRLQMYNLLRRLGTQEVLTPHFRDQIDEDGPLRQQREVWGHARAEHEIDRTLAFDWRYTLAESDLPKVRGTTRLAGIDVGFPLLDQDLLEFSMRLPAEYKLNGLKLRWFFKEALRGFLPDAILKKKKHGFGLPFGMWALHHDGLKKLANESLEGFARRGIVRAAFVQKLMTTLLPTHPGYFGEMVWILVILEQWMRRHAPDYEVIA